MFAKLKRQWRVFADARPGQRFRLWHERQVRKKPSVLVQVLYVVVGIALVLVGLFMLVFPGPGIVVTALGAALIATRFGRVARALDWAEVELRKIKGWVVRKLERA